MSVNGSLKKVLLAATNAAGVILKSRFAGDFEIASKDGINNLVTEVDTQAEAAIIAILQEHFPTHSILSEEVGSLPQQPEYLWIIDPIDGTVNFAHGLPLCCVSIGLMHQGMMLMGAVYNPMMNELFFAEAGRGATLNEKPIQVSSKRDFEKAFLVTGFPYQWPEGSREHPLKTFERLILKGLPIRRLGSAALDLCWVACGRFDAFWEYNLSAWDVAAGYLIVTEAGGRVSNFSGHPYDVFHKETLASNGLIHEQLRKEINNES